MPVISRRSPAPSARGRIVACLVLGAAALLGGAPAAAAKAPAPSQTTVTIAPQPAVAGQEVTITVAVSGTTAGGAVPTGSVTFNDNDGTTVPLAADGGTALVVVAAAGSYPVEAEYSGDVNFLPSTGTGTLTVGRADTAVTLTSSANPAPSGGRFEVRATVAVVPPGDAPVDGTLQITQDGAPLGPAQPLAGVTLSGALTGPLTTTFGFAYSGGENTNPSSASLAQVIAAPVLPPPPPVPPAPAKHITAATLKQMTAGLRAALTRRGPAALKGATETLTTPDAGKLEQQISMRQGGKRTLVAAGRRTFAAPGTGKLALRLTAAGRRALRKQARLKLAIVTRFTPLSGRRVTVVERLTARRRPGRSAAAAGWHVRRLPARRPASTGGPTARIRF
jgi:hypothetical protein